jgi:hypothetical protein
VKDLVSITILQSHELIISVMAELTELASIDAPIGIQFASGTAAVELVSPVAHLGVPPAGSVELVSPVGPLGLPPTPGEWLVVVLHGELRVHS